jgi:uncharacterized protein (DUF169 family)
MDERTKKLADALERHCRPLTQPVAVKLAREGETPPPKARRPVAQLKKRLAVCQGMTVARTLGWTLVFGADDHGCPLPRVFMGHIAPDRLLEGTIADFYQDDPACKKAMEASYPRWPQGAYREVWLSPLATCEFVPDVAVMYGNPAQILTLVQGANYGKGTGITSVSSGRYGCSTWCAGVVQSGESTYMIPGPGERIFAGTQDHEMSFAVPYPKFEQVAEGLAYVRRGGAFRYPVPSLAVLNEPQMPPKYYSIDPDRDA